MPISLLIVEYPSHCEKLQCDERFMGVSYSTPCHFASYDWEMH
jgi:hypothetical protein